MLTHLKHKGYDTDAPAHLKGGRSNLVLRIGHQVLKVFDQSHTNPLFANSADHESAVLRALDGQDISPRLVDFGTFQDHCWLIYDHVDGQVWQEGVASVARLLFDVHQAHPPAGLPLGPNGSRALQQQSEDIIALLRREYNFHQTRPKIDVTPTRQLALVHGDPVPGNLLHSENGLRLIDWQCPMIGDPCEDLALFLSPAMQFIYRGAPLNAEEENAFLAAYPSQTVVARYLDIRPWYHWRMAAYCAWRSERDGDRDKEAFKLEMEKLQALNTG